MHPRREPHPNQYQTAVVQRLLAAAAQRLGGSAGLSVHLRVSESDLRRLLTGEAAAPEHVLLRAVDVVIDDFHAIRREFSAEGWRCLWDAP